jgi:hypothetical protein
MHEIVYTSIFAQYNPKSIDTFTFEPLLFVHSVLILIRFGYYFIQNRAREFATGYPNYGDPITNIIVTKFTKVQEIDVMAFDYMTSYFQVL